MTEQTTGTTPGEQAPGDQVAPPQQAPDGFIEKARYTGAVQKIEALTNAQKQLNDELAAKSSMLEQLNQRLAEMEAAQASTIKVKDASIGELQSNMGTLQQELETLKAFKSKADLAKSMGRPDLLTVLEYLPNTGDENFLKQAITDLAAFAENAASLREQQLRAGLIDTTTTKPTSTTPVTPEAWVKHIESLPLGSPERVQAADRFGEWLKQQNK